MLLLLIAGDTEEATDFLNRSPRGTAVAVVSRERDLNHPDAKLIVCTGRFWRNEAYDSVTMHAMEKAGVQVHYSQPKR